MATFGGGAFPQPFVLRPLGEDVLSQLRHVMFDPRQTKDEDLLRWHQQGLEFSDHVSFGLKQAQGGPCGVLASVQAELLRQLLFPRPDDPAPLPPPSPLFTQPTAGPAAQPLADDAATTTTTTATATATDLTMTSASGGDTAQPMEGCSPPQTSQTQPQPSTEQRQQQCSALPALAELDPVMQHHRLVSALVALLLRACTSTDTDVDGDTALPPATPTTPATPASARNGMVAVVDCFAPSFAPDIPAAHFTVQWFPVDNAPGQGLDPEAHAGKMALRAVLENCLMRWRAGGGVLLFVYSLVLTRGINTVLADMDDPENTRLTAMFGHCTQEMVNLLLLGRATSNTHDGNVDVGGLALKGVPFRPSIGYLTQHEVERLMHVGEYYKTPRAPVWVIGSGSHFSVLFCVDLEALAESTSDGFCRRARKAFRALDPNECGFVEPGQLEALLRAVGLLPGTLDAPGVEALRSRLAASDVILWSDFWVCASRLWAGFPLEDVLTGPAVEAANPRPVDRDQQLAQALAHAGDDAEADDPELLQALAMSLEPSATEASGPASASQVPSVQHHINLYHYNGLEHGTRAAALTPTTVDTSSAADIVGVPVPLNPPPQDLQSGIALVDIIRTRWPGASVSFNGRPPPSLD
eukprot:m.61708 g.61708  ORF g.61708 m.61708 type:complete len:639 (+) comp13251_c0_seq1:132-2048(+)